MSEGEDVKAEEGGAARVEESGAGMRQQVMEQNKVALVLGATGEIGKEVVRQLVTGAKYREVRTLGRREYPYVWLEEAQANGDTSPLQQHVVDFDSLDESAAHFQDVDTVFCCLGTTRAAAGSDEAFRRVDHDYVVNSARLAREAGTNSFHLVSSVGADASSMFLYPRTKGETENAVRALKFPRFAYYRPSVLIAPDRAEMRLKETISRPFMYLFGSWYKPIHVGRVAAVMVANEERASAPDAGGEAATSSGKGGRKDPATEVVQADACVVERWENSQMHSFGEQLIKGAS